MHTRARSRGPSGNRLSNSSRNRKILISLRVHRRRHERRRHGISLTVTTVVQILRSALFRGLLKRPVFLRRGEVSSLAVPGSGVLGAAERNKRLCPHRMCVSFAPCHSFIRASPRDWYGCRSSRKQLRTSPERERTGPVCTVAGPAWELRMILSSERDFARSPPQRRRL